MKIKHLTVLAFVIFVLGFLFISCNKNTGSDASVGDTTTTVAANIDFKIQVEPPQSEQYNDLYEFAKQDTTLTNFINTINQRIEFPGEIIIKIEECGENNAFYNPETSTISICYEFIDAMMAIQDSSLTDEERFLHATAFTFLHEMGHAMVDKLDLPITGKEENAVDELAMIILMSDSTDVTYTTAIEGAMQFYSDALDEDLTEFPYYDTHAPSIERYNDMLTLIVGAVPEAAKDFVGTEPNQLHPDRAEFAALEYEKKLDSWQRLLGDAWKE